MNNVESSEKYSQVEGKEPKIEKLEDSYKDVTKGAEILEEPKAGSFVHALQVFVAWVNNLLGKKD